jgi:hypothetical protein
MANRLFTETLAKYIAGLTDADGSLSLSAAKYSDGTFRPSLTFKIVQAESIDKDFKLITSLHEKTKLGRLNYTEANGNRARTCSWCISASNELELFLPRIMKYLIIKGQHFKRSYDWFKDIKGNKYTQQELTWFRQNLKQSRADTGPLKPKNYPSAAWLAGYADGDGCLHIGARQKLFTVTFHVQDICAIELIQKAFGGNVYHGLWKNNPYVSQYRLSLGGKQLLNPSGKNFIKYILPHLQIKRHKAEQLLAMHQQRLNERASSEEAIV